MASSLAHARDSLEKFSSSDYIASSFIRHAQEIDHPYMQQPHHANFVTGKSSPGVLYGLDDMADSLYLAISSLHPGATWVCLDLVQLSSHYDTDTDCFQYSRPIPTQEDALSLERRIPAGASLHEKLKGLSGDECFTFVSVRSCFSLSSNANHISVVLSLE
jgi:hypothetical protein